MTNSDWIQFFAVIATILTSAIALGITIINFKKQLQLNFFTDYTKRYQEIVLNFPESINEPDFDFGKLDNEIKERTLRYMRSYFDLCSEEYFLWKKGNIEKGTWKEWESGIKYAFSKKAFQMGWQIISLDTIYYEDFSKFVNEIINMNPKF